jgi:hypothetical protein
MGWQATAGIRAQLEGGSLFLEARYASQPQIFDHVALLAGLIFH